MEYFLSGFWSGLELIILFFFLGAFLEIRRSKNYCLLAFASAWISTLVYLNIGLPDVFEQAASVFTLAVIAFVCYRGTALRKILVVVLSYTLGAVTDSIILYGTCTVLGVSLSELIWRKMTYVVAATSGKLITIFLSWLLFRLCQMRTHESIRQKWLLLTIPFPVVSLAMLAVVFYSNRNIGDLSISTVFFSIMLAAANIAIIYLFGLMEKNTAAAKTFALLNQQMDIQTSSIMTLEKNYRAQRKATHEYRSQLQTIHDLLILDNKDAALSYIQQLQGMHTTRIFTVNSHHPIIDAVLNQKYQQAQEYNIDVQMQVNDLSCVSITADRLVVLLSNLLDNAIEACLRLPDHRAIECSMILTESLYLSVRNTSLPVEISDSFIPTSKEPKADHGYGLPHIDFILNQLNAEYALSYQEGWFEFATEIPHD